MPDISHEVITKAAAGDIASFEMIYKIYAEYVFNVALRTLRTKEDAQEITQEVFITVYDKLKGFKQQSSLKTWIYRITVNKAINYLKKESKFKDKTVEYKDVLGSPGAKVEVDAKADKSYKESVIRGLLDALTPEQKACIVLRSFEGLSYEEMARVLKINVNSVRSRLKRARTKLLSIKKEVMRHEL